ncbi:hypothetical protein [Actinoplanes sp. NPDC023714]|uniref:hypothetical protein n=1 Tax=Actinoplanes sp. NPDC023714 TaxID=3154322 RepID=UPI0033EAFB80
MVVPHAPSGLPALLAALPPVHEVIVVVGRGDDLPGVPAGAVRAIRQTRSGVGNAIACGVEAATGDVIVTLPASADPSGVPRLLDALESGADVVHGSRYLTRRAGLADLVVLWFLRVLFGCRPTDPGHGLRAFRRADAGRLGLPRVAGLDPIRGDGPEIEPLLAVRTAAAGLNGAEVAATPRARRPATPLLPVLGALLGEWSAARRAATEPTQDSIVVMTGRVRAAAAPLLDTPHTTARSTTAQAAAAAADFRAARLQAAGAQSPPAANRPVVNQPAATSPGTSWPAFNQHRTAPAANLNRPGEPGFVERRRTERRNTERARTSAAHDRRAETPFASQDRRVETPFAGRGWGKPRLDPAANPSRRRWRDQTTPTRPNLRVINGEATTPSPRRTNHLRSV